MQQHDGWACRSGGHVVGLRATGEPNPATHHSRNLDDSLFRQRHVHSFIDVLRTRTPPGQLSVVRSGQTWGAGARPRSRSVTPTRLVTAFRHFINIRGSSTTNAPVTTPASSAY